MKIEDSYIEFRRRLKAAGKKVTGLLPVDGFSVFRHFYDDERATDAQPEQGDGLAVYFGMSRDGGAVYEVGMVRSFRRAGVPTREANMRLRLSFAYPYAQTIVLAGLDKLPGWPEGNKFCWTPGDQSGLSEFIDGSAQIQAVLNRQPKTCKLRLEPLWGVF